MDRHESTTRKLLAWATAVGMIFTCSSAWAVCPQARARHVAVYDADRQRMLIFGGTEGNVALSDVWTLSLPSSGVLTWATLSTSGMTPPSSIDGTAVYDSRGGRLLYFGGRSTPTGSPTDNDVWALDLCGNSGSWTQLSVAGTRPSARIKHSAIYDPLRDKMVIFGGENVPNTALADTWEFSFSGSSAGTWSQITSSGGPAARSDQPSVYDTEFNRMVVSGGGQQLNTMVLTLPVTGNKVWSQPWVAYWNQVGGQSMIWDPVWNRMVAWGGGGGCYLANSKVIVMAPYQGDPNTYSYGTYIPAGVPSPRTDHTAIYDAANQRMVLFGGQYNNGFLPCTPIYTNTTYTLSLVDWNLDNTSFTYVSGCGSPPNIMSDPDPQEKPANLRLGVENPVAGSARLTFATPASGHVRLEVFDLLGRRVATLADGEYAAGRHSAEWNGQDREGRRANSGVYFVRLRQGAEVREQRLVLQP